MKIVKIAGLVLFAAVWIWLAFTMLSRGGITLVSLLTVAISGIIVFVPLYRKYISQDKKANK
ncbi:MAG: hypothetical protein NC204_04725 [Candidatus Amulumruptor caecigallinarius]|nr:hypothetical protein [Candidatus Amulumruptor caecigallinarius]